MRVERAKWAIHRLLIYMDYSCREPQRGVPVVGKTAVDVEISYIWNCNHFLALQV